ncbi:hypothetical protein [Ectothiorhodospira marina]|uniref:Uncharacterized protein n=1 Tax=Ectothiorhodospira marina TaxID=1396821 RepID=A0A1H7IF55_9GAMM|nr:hypothetical protein [Ectothiorhodospira marina]SEK60397.1 hypothetical protein SAMN05444515_103108 [Ectothiorhodospira marina]
MRLQRRLRRDFYRWRFSRDEAFIVETEPVFANVEAGVVVVSQVHHAAVKAALIAIKSFIYQFGQVKVEILDDGSLTADDYSTLKHHLQGVQITPIADVELGRCPSGGTWERLAYIIKRSQNAYVIQIDSDLLFIGPLPEINNAVRANQSFMIGGPMWTDGADLAYMAKLAKRWGNSHIQPICEAHLDQIPLDCVDRYLRGCSGFAGFAQGAFRFGDLQALSEFYAQLLGDAVWQQWGSEQFASNVMISSDCGGMLLPWPKYQNYRFPVYEGGFSGRVSAVHFIGSDRFHTDDYRRFANRVMRNL